MKTICTDCKFAVWSKTKTGKLSPTGDGRCTAVIPQPALPAAFYFVGGYHAPSGGWLHRHMDGYTACAYYDRLLRSPHEVKP